MRFVCWPYIGYLPNLSSVGIYLGSLHRPERREALSHRLVDFYLDQPTGASLQTLQLPSHRAA